MSRLSMSVIAASVILCSAAGANSEAQAGGIGIANTPFDPGTWRIPQNRSRFVGYTKVRMRVFISVDRHAKTVNFSVDGRRRPQPLRSGFVARYEADKLVGGNSGPPRMSIRFHTGGYSNGRPIYKDYSVGSGKYVFGTDRNGHLELYRQ